LVNARRALLAEPVKGQVTGRSRDDLVFTSPEGDMLHNNNVRRHLFDRAAKEAALDGITPHKLRYNAASLAVAECANVKAVQRVLSHASVAMTPGRLRRPLRGRLGPGGRPP
jgi:site-specific recombinase XerC